MLELQTGYDTTLLSLRPEISASLMPSIPLRISSVCWPKVGGAVLILGSECEYLTGVLTNFIGPHVGCSTSLTISRASTGDNVSVLSNSACSGSKTDHAHGSK